MQNAVIEIIITQVKHLQLVQQRESFKTYNLDYSICMSVTLYSHKIVQKEENTFKQFTLVKQISWRETKKFTHSRIKHSSLLCKLMRILPERLTLDWSIEIVSPQIQFLEGSNSTQGWKNAVIEIIILQVKHLQLAQHRESFKTYNLDASIFTYATVYSQKIV